MIDLADSVMNNVLTSPIYMHSHTLMLQFFHLMMLNIIVSSLLFFHSKEADPSLVEDPALHNGPDAFPTAFEEVRSRALRAYIPLYIISLTIALLGSISALHQVIGLKELIHTPEVIDRLPLSYPPHIFRYLWG